MLEVQNKLLAKMADLGERMTVDGLYSAMQIFLGERLESEGLVKGNLTAQELLRCVNYAYCLCCFHLPSE